MKSNHIQYAITFGLILAFIRVLIDILAKEFQVSALSYSLTSFISLFIEILFIVLAIFMFRKRNNNLLSIKEAVKIGIIIMIITGTFFFVTYNFYKPEFGQNAYLELTKLREPEKLSEAIINVEKANINPNYLMGYATNVLKFMFIGLLFSLFSGLIFNKK